MISFEFDTYLLSFDFRFLTVYFLSITGLIAYYLKSIQNIYSFTLLPIEFHEQ